MSRCVHVLLVAGALAVAAGCAGVPDSGALHLGPPVAAAGGALDDGAVREVPAGPQPSARPAQLVAGFLQAMIDSDDGYGVARSYLAHGTSWSPTTSTTVYAEPPTIKRAGRNQVIVTARRIGVIGPNGTYRVEPGTVERDFTVARRDGQWLISKLAAGALLSSDDAERLLQPASIYFLTPDGHRVVPEPVLEPPEEPGLATTLMRGLLAGPDPLLAPGVRTAVPRGTLLVGNVPISAEGVAEVDLSAGARQITSAQLVGLSAQIVWTLRQIASVSAVRLLANGSPLAAAGAPSLQPVRSWPQFDPGVPPTTTGALLVHDGAVAGLGAAVPPAFRATGLSDPVQSADGTVVAAVRRTSRGDVLLMGPAAGPLRVRLRAAAISPPSFGPDDRVMIAADGGDLYSLGGSGPKRAVRLPAELRGAPIDALAVSRDGTRIALVVGGAHGELRVATIADANGVPAIEQSRMVLPATYDVAGVAWSSADQLVATVGEHDGTRHVVQVGIDGYTVVDLSGPGLPADVDEVSAAPGQPVLASGMAGTWRLGGHRWERVSSGISPSYAG
jgi:hypothetical protein